MWEAQCDLKRYLDVFLETCSFHKFVWFAFYKRINNYHILLFIIYSKISETHFHSDAIAIWASALHKQKVHVCLQPTTIF